MKEKQDNQPTLTPPNEWVSVEEQRPMPNERVLSYAPSRFDYTDFDICVVRGWQCNNNHGVTHWMHLPAPPEKEE